MSVIQTQNFLGGVTPAYRSTKTLLGSEIIIKMSSVMPFAFNAVEFYFVTIHEKPWTRAKEVCSALEYQNGRERDVLKRMSALKTNSLKMSCKKLQRKKWHRNSQADQYYISEASMYELVFGG